jgi:hypothetical protein
VVIHIAVLQADLHAAVLAAVCVDGGELLLASWSSTARLVVNPCVVCWVTICPGVPLKDHVGVLLSVQADALGTDGTYDHVCFFVLCVRALMSCVGAVVEAECLVATVTREREEV